MHQCFFRGWAHPDHDLPAFSEAQPNNDARNSSRKSTGPGQAKEDFPPKINTALLEKLNELTLYSRELERRVKALEGEMDEE